MWWKQEGVTIYTVHSRLDRSHGDAGCVLQGEPTGLPAGLNGQCDGTQGTGLSSWEDAVGCKVTWEEGTEQDAG